METATWGRLDAVHSVLNQFGDITILLHRGPVTSTGGVEKKKGRVGTGLQQ